MKRQVVVTGIGAVTPLGIGARTLYESWRAGVSGIQNGEGIGVLDPHGDLIDQILGYVPESRHQDVVLIDAADAEYPVGFNILSAHSELEKQLEETLTNARFGSVRDRTSPQNAARSPIRRIRGLRFCASCMTGGSCRSRPGVSRAAHICKLS